METLDLGIAEKTKKLKKAIFKGYKKVYELNIYYSSTYPILIFSFYDNYTKKDLKYKHLKDVMKDIVSLRKKVSLFDDIFGRVYRRVEEKYYALTVFAVAKAEEQKIKILESDLLNYSEENTVMFYYQKLPNKQINFSIFDKSLKIFEFSSSFIENHKSKHPTEYLKYLDLLGKTFNEEKEESNDLFDREELESDEEDRPTFVSKPLHLVET